MTHRLKTKLANKKFLLIAPTFFGYDTAIVSVLQKYGAEVYLINDRPFRSHFIRALATNFSSVASFYAENTVYAKQVKLLAGVSFDFVFIINGQTCSRSFISSLKFLYPKAYFILYLWDSVRNRPNSVGLFDLFDQVSTFDPKDARAYDINLRPLFFVNKYPIRSGMDPLYDVAFIATIHSDRYRVAKNVFNALPIGLNVYKFLYMQAPWVYYLRKMFDKKYLGASISEFSFKPLSNASIADVVNNSFCILDIEHPLQTGLTIRSIEAIGAGKKIITTNRAISSCDFYNKNNVLIIDRNSPVIPRSFFESPYVSMPSEIYFRYSIEGWLDELLGCGF